MKEKCGKVGQAILFSQITLCYHIGKKNDLICSSFQSIVCSLEILEILEILSLFFNNNNDDSTSSNYNIITIF